MKSARLFIRESVHRRDGRVNSTPPFDARFMRTSPSPYNSRFQLPAYLPPSPEQAVSKGAVSKVTIAQRPMNPVASSLIMLVLPSNGPANHHGCSTCAEPWRSDVSRGCMPIVPTVHRVPAWRKEQLDRTRASE